MSGERFSPKFKIPKSTHVEIKRIKLYITVNYLKKKIEARNKG